MKYFKIEFLPMQDRVKVSPLKVNGEIIQHRPLTHTVFHHSLSMVKIFTRLWMGKTRRRFFTFSRKSKIFTHPGPGTNFHHREWMVKYSKGKWSVLDDFTIQYQWWKILPSPVSVKIKCWNILLFHKKVKTFTDTGSGKKFHHCQ